MKSKFINFEYFRLNEQQSYEKITSEIYSASLQGYTSVIGLMLADGFLYKNNDRWNILHNNIIEYAKSLGIKISIISGMSHKNNVNCETIPFNFYLHTVWMSYKNRQVGTYNSNTGKFLFLGGVPDRDNRIGLLYNLYKQDLLKNAEWSFFTPWTETQKENSLKYFSCIDDYENFVEFAARGVDDLYDSSKHYGTGEIPIATEWTNDSAWIEPAVFHKTSLSLISEGHPGDENNNSEFATEKIYRVFVQGHPFLLAANPSIFKHLKDLGFKTFENYFPIQDYATVYPEETRLEKLVENLKYFVSNDIDFGSDVEFNKQHFWKLAEENVKILDSLNADPSDIDFYFNRKGFGHLL
ncbi:hypothetical protein EBU71_05430 [bacterium]|nr:hypothetical protein [Candidatus Elulimicrobium humile]